MKDAVDNFIEQMGHIEADAGEGHEYITRLKTAAITIFVDKEVDDVRIAKYIDEMETEKWGMTSSLERTYINTIHDIFDATIDYPYSALMMEQYHENTIYPDDACFDYGDEFEYNELTDECPISDIAVYGDDSTPEDYNDWIEYYDRSKKQGKRKKRKNRSHFTSPVPALENRSYYVLGYGSLVNERSRSRTIKTIESAFVKVKGYSRIFDVSVGSATVLNVQPDENAWINAVLMKIDASEMQELYYREIQYEETEVPIENISFPYGGDVMEMDHAPIIFVSKYHITKEPKPDYVRACIHGATKVSIDFAKDFILTSTLHDKTPLMKYLVTKHGRGIFRDYQQHDSMY